MLRALDSHECKKKHGFKNIQGKKNGHEVLLILTINLTEFK